LVAALPSTVPKRVFKPLIALAFLVILEALVPILVALVATSFLRPELASLPTRFSTVVTLPLNTVSAACNSVIAPALVAIFPSSAVSAAFKSATSFLKPLVASLPTKVSTASILLP
jgi:hypothetical protein